MHCISIAMDETTVIKVEENNYDDICSADPSFSSTFSESVPALLHQTNCEPLKMVPNIDNLVVKSKRKQSLDRHLLRNCEESESSTQKNALYTQSSSSLVQERDAKPYKCEVCLSEGKQLKCYAKQIYLHSHIKYVHHRSTTQFKCEVCSLTFKTKYYLNTHLVRVHKYSSEKLNVKEFPCDICSKIYYTKCKLEQHVVEAHVVDKPYECPVCSKTFLDQEALSKHLEKHDRPPCHVCDVCCIAYKNKITLLQHLRVVHFHLFHCDQCKKSFSNKSEFDTHLNPELQIQYTCQICKKSFPSQCSYTQHIIGCLPSKKLRSRNSNLKINKLTKSSDEFSCELCLKTFDRETYIVAHRRYAHPDSRWPCSKCPRTFKYRSQMKEHEPTHDKVNQFQCKLCDNSFKKLKHLQVHRRKSHSVVKRITCPLCPTYVASSRGLVWHTRIFHGGEGQDASAGGNENNHKLFKCPLCSTTFDRKDYFFAHRRLLHPYSRWPCSKCSETFRTFTEMKQHELTHQEVKAHPCKFCPKSFRLEKELRAHEVKIHFKCQLCSESFVGSTRLKLHIANDHSGREKPFKCIVCNTFWVTESYLKTHTLLSHRAGLLFPCESCSKSFNHPNYLKTHVWKAHVLSAAKTEEKVRRPPESFGFVCHHSKERDFKCQLCPKSFAKLVGLKGTTVLAHRKAVHPKSQWPCSKCSRTFKSRYQVKLHELTHKKVGVKPYECKFCDKSYQGAKYLKVHEMEIHFKCQFCPESFADNSSLKLHIVKGHSGRDRPFKCHICNAPWETMAQLKSHLWRSHRTRKLLFPCDGCSQTFKSPGALRSHERRCPFERVAKKQDKETEGCPESFPFLCHLCSFQTQEDKEMAAHYNSHGLPKVILQRISDFNK